MLQWKGEVEKRCEPDELSVYLYHGPKREQDPRTLADFDLVFTTYSIVGKELSVVCTEDKGDQPAKVCVID